jgi:N utilization substance protein B
MNTPSTGRPGRAEGVGSRHLARQAAVQMLYQWEVGRVGIGEAQHAWPSVVQDDVQLSDPLRAFANRLASGVAAKVTQIDPLISEAASTWRIERMPVIDRLILRLAVFEFLEERETPATVIIDEAIELARAFSTDEAVGFVNGVLDAVRRRLERA